MQTQQKGFKRLIRMLLHYLERAEVVLLARWVTLSRPNCILCLCRKRFERLIRTLLNYPERPAVVLLDCYAWIPQDGRFWVTPEDGFGASLFFLLALSAGATIEASHLIRSLKSLAENGMKLSTQQSNALVDWLCMWTCACRCPGAVLRLALA